MIATDSESTTVPDSSVGTLAPWVEREVRRRPFAVVVLLDQYEGVLSAGLGEGSVRRHR
jgi:hypothetical protein